MERYTRMVKILLLLFSSLFFSFCSNKDNPSIYDPDALRVAGKYKAVTFILPGLHDNPIDIIELDGFINIELFLDYSVKGKWSIPKTSELSYSGFEEDIVGSFSIRNDSLQFIGMNNVISHPQIYYIIKEDSLKAYFGGIPFPATIIELVKD